MTTITETNFSFPKQKKVYRGKVRDLYNINNQYMVMVVTDRISAFDVVLPKGIPYKGQVLNQIASRNMELTKDIVPNWFLGSPDPNVTVGVLCKPFRIEMVIRAYLVGHSAREYKSGKRHISGVPMPEGMIENDIFPHPIITPSTKAEDGTHDLDISKEEIIAKGYATAEEYAILEKYTYALFARGRQIADDNGLILVDTKYEFGKNSKGEIILIDEIHTPDSSRFFYKEGYEERQKKGLPQKQLSKEFVRKWLMENNFDGGKGQQVPEMDDKFVNSVTDRYIELYEKMMGEKFIKAEQDQENIEKRIQDNVTKYLNSLGIK